MKIAFIFSGQGAQYSGMMRDIAEEYRDSQIVFDVADNVLNRKISKLCFEGGQEELNLTHNTQPCVLAADLAAYMAIISNGIKPDAVAGFSLGEYAALVASGVIEIAEAISIVQKRADYMQDAVPVGIGAMAAVMKLSELEVKELCDEVDGFVVPANYNCPGQIVVSGESGAIDRLCELAKDKKIRAVKLPVSAPFHCELMAPAAEKLKSELTEIKFLSPTIPIYLNVDGKKESDSMMIREKLILQAKSPVRWEETLHNMVDDGIDTFIELGPGKTLSGFVKKTFPEGVHILNVTDIESLNETVRLLVN